MIQIRKKIYTDFKQCLISTCTIFLIFISSVTAQASPDEYEDDNSCGLANFINVNGDHQIHNFYDKEDEDWLMFYGVAGKGYNIVIENVGINADPKIELYDSDCNVLKKIDSKPKGQGENMTWDKCDNSGTYYIRVSSCGDECVYDENTSYEIYVYEPNAPGTRGDIEGKIVSPSGQPIAGAKISIGEDATLSWPDGLFKFEMYEPGQYELIVEYMYESITTDLVTVVANKVTKVDIIIQTEPSVCDEKDKGDINKDGAVLIDDVKKIFSYLIPDENNKPTPEEFCLANVYSNGIEDMVRIHREYLKGVFNIFIGDK